MEFICASCGKELRLEPKNYEQAYKGYDVCLDCRPKHGGKREGAGRPSLGTTKKVSITLPDQVWEEIHQKRGKKPLSAFLRELILERREDQP